jgi:hypothetical protein
MACITKKPKLNANTYTWYVQLFPLTSSALASLLSRLSNSKGKMNSKLTCYWLSTTSER